LYALHSEPLPPQDVLALDEGYMAILDKLQRHPSSRLRDLGSRLDQSMTEALVNEGNNSPLSTIRDRLETSETVHHPATVSSPTTFFGRPSSHQEEQVKLVIDNDHTSGIEYTDPSTKIELGLDIQQSTDNKTHNVAKTPPQYENRTTISSSSGFINTTTTEHEDENDKWGAAPPLEDGQPTWGATSPLVVGKTNIPDENSVKPEMRNTGRDATTPSLHYFDDHVRFTPNEKKLLARLVMRLPVDLRQQFIDELVGQIIEKRNTPAQIRNPISFARYLVNELLSGFEIWSSAYERMAKKRTEQTITEDERKAIDAERAAQREAANAAHREKLKQWEAELAAKKNAEKMSPQTQQPKERKP
jgi:hypothetical protein